MTRSDGRERSTPSDTPAPSGPATDLSRQVQDLQRLHEVTMRVAHATRAEEAAREVLGAALSAIGAEQGLLSVCELDSSGLRIGASAGFSEEFVRRFAWLPAGVGGCGAALVRRERVMVEDARTDPLFADCRAAAELGGFVSSHSVPLLALGGGIVGVLTAHFAAPHVPDEREKWLLDLYAQMAANLLERTRTAEALSESERRLHAALSALPACVYTTDADGFITFFNAAATELWGRVPQVGVERWCGAHKIFHAGGGPMALAESFMATALREGRPVQGEIVIERPDGTRRQVMVSPRPMRDASGRLTGALNLLVDVTATKRVEEALRAKERQVRLVTDVVPVMLTQCDAQQRYVFANRTYLDYRRVREDEVLGHSVREVVGDKVYGRIEPYIARVLAGETLEFEVTLEIGGDRRILACAYAPERDGAGKVVGWVSALSDVTSRKTSERELRRLAAIVETSQDAIISKDLDGVITSWNSGAERLYGYTAAEAMGQPVTMLIPADRPDEEPGIMRRILAGERIEHYETVRRRKDGSYVDISLSVSPLLDENGIVIGASKIARDIGANKRFAAALRESEERFRMVADNIAQFAWMTDAEGNRQWVNRRLLDYCGVTVEELDRGAWARMHDAEHLPRVMARYREHIRAGIPWEDVFPIRGRDGSYRWFLAQAIPIMDAAGKVARWFGTNTDIHDLIEAKQTLAKRTETLERVNQLSSTLGAELDLAKIVQQVIEAGSAICEAECGAFFYRSPEGMAAKQIRCTLADAAREQFEELAGARVAEFMASATPPALMRIGDVTGDPRFGDAAQRRRLPVRSYLAVPVVSRSGEVLGGFVFGHTQPHAFVEETERVLIAVAAHAAIAIDNSQLYAALQTELAQHKAAEEALRQSERQLRLVTDNAIVFLAQCDAEHRLKFVNRPYAARFGREPQELVGRHLAEVVGPEAYRLFKPQVDAALAGRRVEFEVEIPYAQLGRRWVRVIHEPERESDGRVVGLIAVIMDITARKQTEQEIEAARDKALAASRAKDDFLAALSHELRTPLNPVLLLASEAAADPALPDEVRADFATIRKNVELEARLIDDLLDLTRITRGKLSLNLGVQDVHAIVKDALATMRGELDQKQLELSCELGAGDAMVWGDAVRLQQVLWNVLKNAVKFTPEGGRISLRTRNSTDRERAVIEISDTGIGMTSAELARAFDAFSQGDHASAAGPHRFGGVGLGLTISRMLVELHRGRIEAHSAGRDHGSSFTIELPVVGRDEREAAEVRVTRAPTRVPFPPAGDGETGPVKLLLVEDHEPTRAALAQLLKRRNYDVVVAGSVAEARAAAATREFDLVLSDVGLPDGNGYDLMSELRRGRKLVGIALTGYGMDHDIVRSQAAGFVVHLTKPVTIQALDRALEAAAAKAKVG